MSLLPPKGKGVIRKRGETSCLPSCVPAAHSREYAVMIWHTRRAESWPRPFWRAESSRPTERCCKRHCILGRAMRALTRYGRNVWHAEVVAQASFSCRCAAIHLPAPLRTQWHRPTGAQCAPLRGVNSRRHAEIVAPYRVQKAGGALLPADDALQHKKKRQPKLSLF